MFDVIIKCDEPICGLIPNESIETVYNVRRKANEVTTEMLIYNHKAGWMWINAEHCIPRNAFGASSPHIAVQKCKTDVWVVNS